jgi:hypothetical protein
MQQAYCHSYLSLLLLLQKACVYLYPFYSKWSLVIFLLAIAYTNITQRPTHRTVLSRVLSVRIQK